MPAAKRQTIVTFIFFGVVTGVDGGTARDLLIGAPVFWVQQNATLLICIAAAMLVWMVSARRLGGKALLSFHAVGLPLMGLTALQRRWPSALRRSPQLPWAC